jgi:hypothetical protein
LRTAHAISSVELASSSAADDRDESARIGVERLGERVAQDLQLPPAPDHRRRGEPARLLGADLAELPGGHRLALALQIEVGDSLRFDGVADALDGRLSEEHLAGQGGLLEPCRDVDRVAGREALVGAGHDLAGVDSDAKADRRPEVALELLVERVEFLAHLSGGANCAQRVVLVQDRDAEDGHHRVSDELLDAASVALDDISHRLEEATEHAARAFRVEPLAELGRADDVAEEDRHVLPLLARLVARGRPAFRAELERLGGDVPAGDATGHVPSLRPLFPIEKPGRREKTPPTRELLVRRGPRRRARGSSGAPSRRLRRALAPPRRPLTRSRPAPPAGGRPSAR